LRKEDLPRQVTDGSSSSPGCDRLKPRQERNHKEGGSLEEEGKRKDSQEERSNVRVLHKRSRLGVETKML